MKTVLSLIFFAHICAFAQDSHLKGNFRQLPFPAEAEKFSENVKIESKFIQVDVSFLYRTLINSIKFNKLFRASTSVIGKLNRSRSTAIELAVKVYCCFTAPPSTL